MEDLPLLPVLLPRSQITAAPPSSPSSSSSDEDGDEVDDDAVGGSVGGDGDVGAGDGGASGSDVNAMSIDGGRVGGGEVGDEGGGPCYAPSVWPPEVVTKAHRALYQHTTLVSRPNRRILIRRVGTRHHYRLTRACQDAKGKSPRKTYVSLGNLYFIREGKSSVYASHLKSL